MEQETKDDIARLTADGWGYKKIATVLNLTRDQVRHAVRRQKGLPRYDSNYDRERRAAYDAAYFQKHKERINARRKEAYDKDPTLTLEAGRRWREANRESIIFSRCRRNAKERGIPFELGPHRATVLARLRCEVCELTGLHLERGDPGRNPRAPSIDRIDSSKGYTLDNIRIVCWALNAAFNTWGEDAAAPICDAWLSGRTLGHLLKSPEHAITSPST